MYNRYIPQPDGSWQKNQRQEPQQSRRPQQMQQRHQPEPEAPPCCPPPEPCPEPEQPPCREQIPASCSRHDPVGGFLRRLIPKDFDTGDLLVVLLLLLIAGDNCEDRSTALLTLALYFFM